MTASNSIQQLTKWTLLLLMSAQLLVIGSAFQQLARAKQQGMNQSGFLQSKSHSQLKMVAVTPGASQSITASSQSQVLDWSFLDGVYLITCPNADKDGERIAKAKRTLEKIGLSDNLEVKRFETDDENRIRGCYTSHISVIQDILSDADTSTSTSNNPLETLFAPLFPSQKDNSKKPTKDLNVLILEDNLAVSGGLKQACVDAVANFCTNRNDWDMVHLSYIPYVPDLKVTKTDTNNIVKLSCGIGSALGTTAYIINRRGMETLLEEDRSGGFYAPIPDVMAKLFPESRYASDPTMFVRAPNTKSLVNPQLDDLRQVLFQPSIAAFSQRLLVLTGLPTNKLLPIVILHILAAGGISAKISWDAAWALWTTGSFDGPILLPIVSTMFTIFTLGVIGQGALLAPKPSSSIDDDDATKDGED
jgi:hypothetical protein